MRNLKNLRTLMLFSYSSWRSADHLFSILKELKSLRVLSFGSRWLDLQIPTTLCHCLHLRYLNLGRLFSGILPKSLSRLYHLQVLSAAELPLSGSMFRLLKFGELKILDVQTLEFKVERKERHRIGVLKDMGMEMVVQGNLCIMNLENVTDKAEAAEADLGSKQYLDGLELHWDSSAARINGHDADQEVAQALKPHPNLKMVTVQGFRGSRCPGWLESKWLDSLQSLSLIDCSELQVLPSLDHLPLLKKCTVEGCPKLMSFPRFPPTLEEIKISKTGIYPELSLSPSSTSECFRLSTNGVSSHTALLHDHHLRAIHDLYISDCKESMPTKWLLRLAALKQFNMYRCQKWMMSDEEEGGSGVLPSSLESLYISNCPVTERWLSRCLQGLTSLKYLEIRLCPELKSLPQEDGGGVLAISLESLAIHCCPVTDLSLISHCTSLKKLIIRSCHKLKSLPQEDGGGVLATLLESLEIRDCPVTDLSFISHCTSLKSLTIENCPELKSLLEEGLPTSLEEVHFVGYGVPKETVVRCLQGLPSLSKLTVDFWTHFTALPSLRHLKVKKSSLCEPSSKVELPESLQSLSIWLCDVSDTFLCTCLQGLTSLSELEIWFCNELTSLPPAQVLQRLTTLKGLHIIGCDELMSLGALHALVSLKDVAVQFCPKLKSLPKEGLPAFLQELALRGCHPELKQQIHKKKGPNWAKVAHIPFLDIE